MQCPHCGAEVMAGNRFCSQCRKRVVPPGGGVDPAAGSTPVPPPAARPPAAPASAFVARPTAPPVYGYNPPAAATPHVEMRRPGLVTLIAVLDLIGGGGCLLLALFSGLAALGSGQQAVIAIVMAIIYLAFGAASLAVGIGLLQLKEWARSTRVVLAVIGLLGIPCGTVISILILVYLLKPGIKVLFSGRSAEELTPLEARDVAAATQGSTVVVVVVACVILLVGVAMIGIIAAIAIPSLLRARIAANEADAIGDLRTIVSAEVTYQTAFGHYAPLECLVKPSSCNAEYKGATFLDPEAAKSVKQGYHRTFTLSPDGAHFAFVAVPVTSGSTGTRNFCVDQTGMICQARSETGMFADGTCDTQHCTPI
jgi:type IV pilus assembly protein PilA